MIQVLQMKRVFAGVLAFVGVVALSFGSDSAHARPGAGSFGKRKAPGTAVVEGKDCCALASSVEKDLLNKLELALGTETKGVLGNKTTQSSCTLHREFYVTYWAGADGWTYDNDAATDLLPKVKKVVGSIYSPARAESCTVVKANPEGAFGQDVPVVRCAFDRSCQRGTASVKPRPLPGPGARSAGRPIPCDATIADANKKLAGLNDVLAAQARGILEPKVAAENGKAQVSFYGAWWGGADGWSYSSNLDDAAKELMPKLLTEAQKVFPGASCTAVSANPEKVFMAPQAVVECKAALKCGQ